MGVNYTANVYYGGEITYRHICTDDGIYKDYFDEYKSSGFVFKDDLAYFFELKNGVQIIDTIRMKISMGILIPRNK